MRTFEEILRIPLGEYDNMSPERKSAYLYKLREYLGYYQKTGKGIATNQEMIQSYFFHKYGCQVINIPTTPGLVVCNHPNPRDLQTIFWAFSAIQHTSLEKDPTQKHFDYTFLASSRDISKYDIDFFNEDSLTLLDSNNNGTANDSLAIFIRKFMNTDYGFMFGEPVLNFHPVIKMLGINPDVIKAAIIAEKPIIPCAIQYAERSEIVEKEEDIYCPKVDEVPGCLIRFGSPISIEEDKSLTLQCELIKERIEFLIDDVRLKCEIDPSNISADALVNHTYLKSSLIRGYNSEEEMRILGEISGVSCPTIFTMNDNSILVPGQPTEDVFKRILAKKN